MKTRWYTQEELFPITKKILQEIGKEGAFSLEPLLGGGNNRVFKIFHGHENFLLKYYFTHPDDHRDRLTAEFSFLSYAEKCAVDFVPKPLVKDRHRSIALYEYIDGKKIEEVDITSDIVNSAREFFIQLNKKRREHGALQLANASEASFSIAEHFEAIKQRIKRLYGIQGDDDLTKRARYFVRQLLLPAWQEFKEDAICSFKAEKINIDELLKVEEQCISPSDFGFHNALLRFDGRVQFIDFEYAGWDDPVKMVCDFFCQPQLPVPDLYFDNFSQKISLLFPNSERIIKIIMQLLPLYRLKWCCIMLNDFLATDNDRRMFAGKKDHQRKEKQLEKTIAYFNNNRAL